MSQSETLSWIPGCRADVLDNQSVFLSTEFGYTLFRGEVFCKIAPFLSQKSHSADTIVDALKEKISPGTIYFALNELVEKKWVIRSLNLLPNTVLAYCNLLHCSEKEAYNRLCTTCVFVDGPEELTASLKKTYIQVVEKEEHANFLIRCVHDYLEPDLRGISHTKPWLLCNPYGSWIWVGPLFHAQGIGCYQCLEHRLRLNRPEEDYVQSHLERPSSSPTDFASLPVTEQFGWSWIAIEVFRYVVQQNNPSLEGRVQTLNTLTGEKEAHRFVRRSACSVCANLPKVSTASIPLHSRDVKELDGGFRTLSPVETVKKYEHIVSPICGIVNELSKFSTGKGSSIHAYEGRMNVPLPKFSKQPSPSCFSLSCFGKGQSDAQAKASVLCESLERYSGFWHGDEEKQETTFESLGEKAVHPQSLLLYSSFQYQNREKLNPEYHSFWKIPPLFSEKDVLPWTAVYSLTENCTKYLPTCCCYCMSPKIGWQGECNSNGCSAGNCLEEAILQGFFELVERDSIAIWWYNRLPLPRVNIASFRSRFIEGLVKEYERQDREIWVLDLTTDLGIPTFAALSRLIGHPFEQVIFGFGTHLNAKIALLRALTEMNRHVFMKPYWHASSGDLEQEKIEKGIVRDWMETVRVDDHPHLKGSSFESKASDYKPWESRDILEDVHACRSIVEREGMEMLVLNQTRPEIGLPVVRVVVPGLRHFWPRFAPGRLYDVPVKMGWLKEPLQESQLNPRGVWF